MMARASEEPMKMRTAAAWLLIASTTFTMLAVLWTRRRARQRSEAVTPRERQERGNRGPDEVQGFGQGA